MRALVAVALCVLAACEPIERAPRFRAAGASEPRTGGTLRLVTPYSVHTLDPAIAYDEVGLYVLHAVADTLVDYDRDMRPIPRLAERWEVSPDGRTYTFHLRANVKFSDGRPIEAAHVAYSLERARTLPDSPFGQFLIDVEAIRAHDPRTLEIRLARANAAFVYVLAMKFTAPLTAEHVRAAGGELRRRPLSSGPYVLRAWDEGRRLVLERNPHYHDPTRQRIDRIELLEHVPRDVQLLMFERGDLDAVDKLGGADRVWIASQPAWRPYLKTGRALNVFGSRMNVTKKPFDDRRVRQAFNYALDKRAVVKLLAGNATPSHGILPPGAFGRDDTLAPYPHDPARARALLAEAGYARGLTVDYVTFADDEADKLALALQADLAAVGVTMRITRLTFAAWASVVGNADGPAFSIATWAGDHPDATSFLDPKFHSRAIAASSSTNDSFYANPDLDALLDAARGEPDAAKRAALYRRADRIIHEDAPWIWSYHQPTTELVQPYLRDFAPHPTWVRDLTGAWLDLDASGRRMTR